MNKHLFGINAILNFHLAPWSIEWICERMQNCKRQTSNIRQCYEFGGDSQPLCTSQAPGHLDPCHAWVESRLGGMYQRECLGTIAEFLRSFCFDWVVLGLLNTEAPINRSAQGRRGAKWLRLMTRPGRWLIVIKFNIQKETSIVRLHKYAHLFQNNTITRTRHEWANFCLYRTGNGIK